MTERGAGLEADHEADRLQPLQRGLRIEQVARVDAGHDQRAQLVVTRHASSISSASRPVRSAASRVPRSSGCRPGPPGRSAGRPPGSRLGRQPASTAPRSPARRGTQASRAPVRSASCWTRGQGAGGQGGALADQDHRSSASSWRSVEPSSVQRSSPRRPGAVAISVASELAVAVAQVGRERPATAGPSCGPPCAAAGRSRRPPPPARRQTSSTGSACLEVGEGDAAPGARPRRGPGSRPPRWLCGRERKSMLLVPSTARANLEYAYASSRVSRPPVSTPGPRPRLARLGAAAWTADGDVDGLRPGRGPEHDAVRRRRGPAGGSAGRRRARSEGEPVLVGDPLLVDLGVVAGQPAHHLAAPVVDPDGRAAGVVLGDRRGARPGRTAGSGTGTPRLVSAPTGQIWIVLPEK